MSKQSLLLVDGDTRSLRVLEVSLRKAGFTVTPAVSVQDALDKLEFDAPDLIISETTFPDGDGFELRRRVRATPDWGEIPFIFLTAENAIENKIRGLELGVDDYLTKPIYIKEIITRINILLQKRQRTRFEERRDGRTRFAGRVADMPVVDVIQTIEISRKSGVIQFVGAGGRQAAIYFRDGKVIDAEAGTLQGEDAVYRLLTWNEGEFEVVFRTVRRREVIAISSQGLLMEGMRRLDEWSRLQEQLPPVQHRFEVDAVELAARLGDVPDDHNKLLRLIDGKRTLLEVIDASDLGDLECVQAISKLYFEELLIDLDQDTAAPVKRDTGRPMALAEVDNLDGEMAWEESSSGPPPPLAEVKSGVSADAAAALAAAAAAMARAAEAVDVATADAPEPDEPTPGALMGGYRKSSLRLIDEAVAAAEAVEPLMFDDVLDFGPQVNGAPHGTATAHELRGASRDLDESDWSGPESTPVETPRAAASGGAGGAGRGGGGGAGGAASDGVVEASGPAALADAGERARAAGAAGGGRPASTTAPLALGAAAAKARTSGLASGEHGARPDAAAAEVARASGGASGGGAAPALSGAGAAAAGLGAARLAGTASAGLTPVRTSGLAGPALPRAVTDSGLRMIGSLGRDRAEASGELLPAGSPAAPVSETQRELVTILPRRVTREMAVVTMPDAAVSTNATPPPVTGRAPTPPPPPPPTPVDGDAATQGAAPSEAAGAKAGAPATGAATPAPTPPSPIPARSRTPTPPPPIPAGARKPPAPPAPAVTPEGRTPAAPPPSTGQETAPAAAPVEAPAQQTAERSTRPGAGAARPSSGIGVGPTVLIVLAILLAVTAVFLRLRKRAPAVEPAAVMDAAVSDAATASVEPPAQGSGLAQGSGGAGSGAAAGSGATAGSARGSAAAPEDKAAQAKVLLEQANEALSEGAFERALRAADASLAMKKSARAYLARAKALQRLERIDDALAAIAAAEQMSPRYPGIFELRGRILWSVRRKEEARQQFELFLEVEPQGPRAAQIKKLLAEPN